MGKESIQNDMGNSTVYSATKSHAAENLSTKTFLNPAPKGDESDLVPTLNEALRPICPNPNKGFQPLSKYQVARITKQVMHRMKALCEKRHIGLDLYYWEQQTKFILGAPSTKDMLVISSPAGSGKSTWIEAFTHTIVELFDTEDLLASSLVGVAVVLQKVEDLNRLAAELNSDSTKDNPNMVALQGWSQSGQEQGFCQNPGVSCFMECNPNSCTHAQNCEILKFRRQAPKAPIIGLTQERFVMLRESGNLTSVLYRLDNSNYLRPRRYLIFDEKFQMAQINTLDKNCIDQASIEFSELIEKISAVDSQVRSLQQSLAYHIDIPFQALRRSLCIETEYGNRDIQAGFCNLPSDYKELQRDIAFRSFSDFVLHQKKQYATKHLRTALAVMGSLYNGQSCLFSKVNGCAITHIDAPPSQYGESQSVIFDATAEIDEDYHCLQNAQFSKGVPLRKDRTLIFHIYTHKDLNVSKNAMNNSWKISALSQLISSLMENTHGGIFICSYKVYAEILAQKLKETMSDETFKRILLMPDRENAVPYFGGTNGSNVFNSATTVFVLGYPRMNPRDYLIYACAAYGKDRISRELAGIETEELTARHSDFIWNLPSVRTYMTHHLAARLEQEIYRCALRTPDFTGEINVYFFCPMTDMMDILGSRLNPNRVVLHSELPPCVEMCKRSARRYENGLTSYGRLAQFLADWDGTRIPVQRLRASLEISSSVWKDLMGEDRVKRLLNQCQVQRKGRGPNAVWFKDTQPLCA